MECILLYFSIDKSKALSLVLHCADISHPAKDWDIHKRWTDLLLEEFFRQVNDDPLLEQNINVVLYLQFHWILNIPSNSVSFELEFSLRIRPHGRTHCSLIFEDMRWYAVEMPKLHLLDNKSGYSKSQHVWILLTGYN